MSAASPSRRRASRSDRRACRSPTPSARSWRCSRVQRLPQLAVTDAVTFGVVLKAPLTLPARRAALAAVARAVLRRGRRLRGARRPYSLSARPRRVLAGDDCQKSIFVDLVACAAHFGGRRPPRPRADDGGDILSGVARISRLELLLHSFWRCEPRRRATPTKRPRGDSRSAASSSSAPARRGSPRPRRCWRTAPRW